MSMDIPDSNRRCIAITATAYRHISAVCYTNPDHKN